MDGDGHATFLGKVKEKLRPFSLKAEAAFINFVDGVLPTNAHEKAYFGDNTEELRCVKAIWDNDSFFKWDQSVELPGAAGGLNDDKQLAADAPNEEDLTDAIASGQWDHYETTDFMKDLEELAELGFQR